MGNLEESRRGMGKKEASETFIMADPICTSMLFAYDLKLRTYDGTKPTMVYCLPVP
jgi:hypothetical protein